MQLAVARDVTHRLEKAIVGWWTQIEDPCPSFNGKDNILTTIATNMAKWDRCQHRILPAPSYHRQKKNFIQTHDQNGSVVFQKDEKEEMVFQYFDEVLEH